MVTYTPVFSPISSQYCHKVQSGFASTVATINSLCASNSLGVGLPDFFGSKLPVSLFSLIKLTTVLGDTINCLATLRIDVFPVSYAVTILVLKSKEYGMILYH